MRWSYKRVTHEIATVDHDAFEQELDALGREGWELVATVPHERHGYSRKVYLLFKRPLAGEDSRAAAE